MAESIHVLVVDDSAVARLALEELLREVPGVRTSLAGDGFVAQQRIAIDPPDVVLLDLEMPRMHGLELLAWLCAHHPVPVVVCSSATTHSDVVRSALASGAVDSIEKPSLSAERIGASIRAAHGTRVARASSPSLPSYRASDAVIAIGASTGGHEAISRVLARVARDAPGIVIAQHMPAQFTRQFAGRLDRECALAVREASPGDVLESGVVLVAPGGRHTRVVVQRGRFAVEVVDDRKHRHQPSVDVLFHSVAAAAGARAVGIVLTGMGRDGADGLAAMRRAGARTIAQDGATSAVYGMPRAAAERGAAEAIAPLDAIPDALASALAKLRRA